MLLSIIEVDLQPLLEEIDSTLAEIANVLASWKMVEDQHIMAEYAIIGMTTSFAASRQQILKELKPRIGERTSKIYTYLPFIGAGLRVSIHLTKRLEAFRAWA